MRTRILSCLPLTPQGFRWQGNGFWGKGNNDSLESGNPEVTNAALEPQRRQGEKTRTRWENPNRSMFKLMEVETFVSIVSRKPTKWHDSGFDKNVDVRSGDEKHGVG